MRAIFSSENLKVKDLFADLPRRRKDKSDIKIEFKEIDCKAVDMIYLA